MPRSTRTPTTAGTTAAEADALEALVAAAAPLLPLPALSGDAYAAGHAAFEARSDQRELIVQWLVRLLLPRSVAPLRVLSVGCGDGSVDEVVARALAAGGQPLTYDGVEPHPRSAARWRARLASVPGVSSSLQGVPFDRHVRRAAAYDVVVFVHSLYYVPDVPAALAQARALLAPGGEVLVLHAPYETLNRLVGVLAPRDGHPQWFAGAVAAELGDGTRIDARLDLAGAAPEVLDFTVQAVLPAALRPLVLDHLRAGSPDLLVPHPVEAFVGWD